LERPGFLAKNLQLNQFSIHPAKIVYLTTRGA
jgi:hypothetical protein